jgi:hypothetical protein
MFPAMKLLLIPFLLAALAAAPAAQKSDGNSSQASQEDDVRVAVFHYQFKNVELAFAYYFISVDGKKPSSSFLQRFRDEAPPVESISECVRVKKPIRGIVSRKDDKPGIIFNVGSIKWISAIKVDVAGGFECGDACTNQSGVYHVSRQDNKWVVESFEVAAKSGS